jgi:hypothetical protein
MSDGWWILTPSLIKDEHENVCPNLWDEIPHIIALLLNKQDKKNENVTILENHIKYFMDMAELCERHISDKKEKDRASYISLLNSNLQNFRITFQYWYKNLLLMSKY